MQSRQTRKMQTRINNSHSFMRNILRKPIRLSIMPIGQLPSIPGTSKVTSAWWKSKLRPGKRKRRWKFWIVPQRFAATTPTSGCVWANFTWPFFSSRSEEHTSELQSPDHLVCRLLLEKKKNTQLRFMVDARMHARAGLGADDFAVEIDLSNKSLDAITSFVVMGENISSVAGVN